MVTSRPRWDTDDRGEGIVDGAWIAPGVAQLQAALAEPGWVAEAPEDHLLPHLARACAAEGSPWQLVGAELQPDGVYVVDLAWERKPPRQRQLQVDAFALIGEVAEGATFLRQVVTSERIEYHVTTGLLDGDSPFAPHGHLVLLRVNGPGIPSLLDGMRR